MTSVTGKPSLPSALRSRWLLGGLGVAVVAAGLFLPNMAGPAPDQQPANEFRSDGPEMGMLLLRLGGGTLLVLALCVATLWLCRRWFGPAQPGAIRGGSFEILESLPLGIRCRVHLVRVGERLMLAGLDTSGLRTLLPLDGTMDEAPKTDEPGPLDGV